LLPAVLFINLDKTPGVLELCRTKLVAQADPNGVACQICDPAFLYGTKQVSFTYLTLEKLIVS
jgi:hypothetical protein